MEKGKMEEEVRAFLDWLMKNKLSTGEIALWHVLTWLNYNTGWKETFSVPPLTVQLFTRMSKQGIAKARAGLVEKGLLVVLLDGNKSYSPIYQLVPLASVEQPN